MSRQGPFESPAKIQSRAKRGCSIHPTTLKIWVLSVWRELSHSLHNPSHYSSFNRGTKNETQYGPVMACMVRPVIWLSMAGYDPSAIKAAGRSGNLERRRNNAQ